MNRYYLDISGTQLAYTVKVNDVMIFSDRWQTTRSDACPVNQWVINGKNQLSANLGVGLGKENPSENPACLIRIRNIDLAAPDAEQLAASIDWKLGQDELVLPLNLAADFAGPALPTWRWQQGEILDLEKPDTQGLNEFLFSIHQLLSQKNQDGLIAVLRTKSDEMAISYGVSFEERLADQKEFFADLFADPNWGMQDFNPDDRFLQVEGFGQLLKVTNKLGRPFLNSREFSDGSAFGLKFHLCKCQGRWEVAR